MSKNLRPAFICVSPHKTGTTWLYMVLRAHLAVWLPPKKELWFLNQIGESYVERWVSFFTRTGMPGDNRKSFEEDIGTYFKRNTFKTENWAVLWWWMKLLFLPYTLHTYPHLFPSSPHSLSGDITPNYYFISPDLIRKLFQHNPDLRVIIVLRDPVDRAWSYTRMDIPGYVQKRFGDISYSEFTDYFAHIHHWWRPYLRTIRAWKEHFQQVYVGYYDLLEENPVKFYEDICEFLQIDSSNPPPNLEQRVHRGMASELPLELREYLIRQYIDEIRELADWSDSPHPQKWLRHAEASL